MRHFKSSPHIQEGHGDLKLYLDHKKVKNKVKLSYPKFGHGIPISEPIIIFTINVRIGTYFVYYKYMNHDKKTNAKYDSIYQTTI